MAMAPEQLGIGIRRYFTKAGVHPYDTVEWERRDARIPNFKDGTDAFFQPDVEFPVHWSQNATNIVAQKYFRGTLGTPERETSLKQVIDRVADTITAWGVRDGYFVDDDEAAAFRNELKYILVHQRAAFNSPVWFNIGVHGVPQQASACQPYDALVSTPDGFVPIGRLVEEDAIGAKVFDAHGVTAVVAVKHNGTKPVLRIHTKAGITLDVTADHLVWRASGQGTGAFVPAGELRPGDALCWHRAESWGSGEFSSREVAEAALAGAVQAEELAREVDMRVPAQLFDAPLPVVAAYLRSLFQAEGYVSRRERTTKVGLDMVAEHLVRGVQQLLMRFGIYSRVRFKGDARPGRKGCWSLSIQVAGDRRRFADEIGFVDPRKAEALEASFDVPGRGAVAVKRLEIERVEPLGVMDVYDIQTESGEYLSNNVRVHNCFILSVDDTMDGILNWYREEGIIFKGGSGAGTNLSNIRSSFEPLAGGGTASGPVSFMRGADASAGTIKSGGKTRRAAKMVILDVDHPDIEEFLWCKAREERKARVLRDAGFDMDLDGADSHSIQYQNANNSVRVTDEFMQAVVEDRDWALKAVTTGETIRTVRARDLMHDIAQAAWECADPGMQYDTTINRWHTAPNTGRINGSNPCFPGSERVHTDKGMVPFAELVRRVSDGEEFGIYTHDATNPDSPAERLAITRPEAVMITGYNEIVKLRFSNGMELRCTPSHKIFTTNRGYVAAEQLTEFDRVKVLNLPAPAIHADWRLPVPSRLYALAGRGDKQSRAFRLPEKWDRDLAHYLGWLVGDGCISGDVVTTVYGSSDEQEAILPRHRELAACFNGGVEAKPSVQANGTVQLRQSRRVIARFFEALGVSREKAARKVVPHAIYQAPSEVVAAFLQGLFDADGCVYDGDSSRYVGLGSASRDLLIGVQRLLSTFGIFSCIYEGKREGRSFEYQRRDGTTVDYPTAQMFDLRIANRSIARFAKHIGFAHPVKAEKLARLIEAHDFPETDETVRLRERSDDGVELTFNLSEPRNHSYVVNGHVVRNCSEYMHLDNSACNLASINLLHYLDGDGNFDVDAFRHTVEVVFTAQEILVGNADYPTERIGETSRAFRQLGLGYANLGALLMAEGLPYDSDAGRAWAAAITSLMTGHAYATSARTAARMGPFAGYAENADAMLNVLRMHRAAAAGIDEELVPHELLGAAQRAWDEAVELGEVHGVRNSQASVLAPTGCLVGGTLVATERGLVRLGGLGDPLGAPWQPLGIDVATDDGPRPATQFYVNGVEPVVDVTTSRGYRIRGTAKHRVKVVDEHGAWVWRHLADVRPGDRVPLALDQLVGSPNEVPLPPLPEAHWTGEHHLRVPRTMTPDLAELVGYFMGDGSLHAKGLRLCVAGGDLDVVERLEHLGKECFGLTASVTPKRGYAEVAFHSVRLTLWWEACGFAKREPAEGHSGKGWTAHIPDAVLHANDRAVYHAFLRGLFEADGTVTAGIPHWSTTSIDFSHDVQTLLLALGFPTTRKFDTTGWGGSPLAVLRLLNTSYHSRWLEEVGFLSARKQARVVRSEGRQAGRHDHVPITRALVDRLAPENDRLRRVLLMEVQRGRVSRRIATQLYERTRDPELGHLLDFFYDTVASAELGDEELTFDLSVPSNVTYVANGFVSHNTIGLMMDCDTTGIEPDLALTKSKKLVGGGTMLIVNQTIPRALRKLGYSEERAQEIVDYINEHKTIVGAPGFNPEHLPVFACSMGDNPIHYMGHVKMMAAVQPFISGAISKTVNMPEEVSVEDVEDLYVESWRLGLKAVAIYRDNCKVAQPLSTQKKAGAEAGGAAAAVGAEVERIVETIIVQEPVRQKLPRKRNSKTFSFRVADCHGYVTVGEFEDGRPGEVFLKVAKQGSTLAGIMDAFAISVSHGLQYGVPLRAFVDMFTNMRFEPAGMTDDPEIRFATSLVDYIFRRLAVEYLSYEERRDLGILTVGERSQPTLPGVEEATTPAQPGFDLLPPEDRAPSAAAAPTPPVPPAEAPQSQGEVVLCYVCGDIMQRAGSCFACPSCGATSGCS